MEGSEAPKTLTTVFLDGTEICKKMLQLPSIADILDACKSSLTCNAECDRLLKFNTDFNEYIDTDINGNVGNLDKYHILFKSTKPKHSREQLVCTCISPVKTQLIILFYFIDYFGCQWTNPVDKHCCLHHYGAIVVGCQK